MNPIVRSETAVRIENCQRSYAQVRDLEGTAICVCRTQLTADSPWRIGEAYFKRASYMFDLYRSNMRQVKRIENARRNDDCLGVKQKMELLLNECRLSNRDN